MVFSSAFFIFVFLPILLITIGLAKNKLHNIILLFASLFFYSWGNVSHTFILFLSIIINYVFGLLINSTHKEKAKIYLIIAIIINLGLLGYLKYFNFFMDNLNSSLSVFGYDLIEYKKILLPIGISFFTFQAMSYIIDVYRKQAQAQKNILDLALYICLFPQLIAGPIVRYVDVAKQLTTRSLNTEKTTSGIQRFIFGLSKKIIIANNMAILADGIFSTPINEISTGVAWLGIISYSLQIYFDFSGYSDMAIGLGKVLGFDFNENFNYPYISVSIKDFWRRWHISLSTWFRDYLYIPLGGSRKGKTRTLLNLMIVFLCTGVWHGASWSFVIWGLFHGTFILLERSGLDKYILKLWRPIQISYTLLLVMIGWVFFRQDSFGNALEYLGKMSFLSNSASEKMFLIEYLDYKTIFILSFATLYSLRFFRYSIEYLERRFSENQINTTYQVFFQTNKFIISVFLLIISILYLSASTYNPFIYFRF